MNEIFKNINEAKYIQIIVKEEELPAGSALYTYVLRLHKKVSLVCLESNVDLKYSFLPWFDKLRTSLMPSADFTLSCNFTCLELYDYLLLNDIKLNAKISTALYAGILDETDGFKNNLVDGTVFARITMLIGTGAEHRLCTKNMLRRSTLGRLRLKALMLRNMRLENSAKDAVFYMSDEDYKSTGTTTKDAQELMQEAFSLEYVEKSILFNNNTKNKFIINKEI